MSWRRGEVWLNTELWLLEGCRGRLGRFDRDPERGGRLGCGVPPAPRAWGEIQWLKGQGVGDCAVAAVMFALAALRADGGKAPRSPPRIRPV
jgi:hypothetical protein